MKRKKKSPKDRRYKKRNPWTKYLNNARKRCNDIRHDSYPWYGGKGIRCLLKTWEIKRLWYRDRAWELRRPSLDRIDDSLDYEFKNCRFVELSMNRSGARVAEEIMEMKKVIRSWQVEDNGAEHSQRDW